MGITGKTTFEYYHFYCDYSGSCFLGHTRNLPKTKLIFENYEREYTEADKEGDGKEGDGGPLQLIVRCG